MNATDAAAMIGSTTLYSLYPKKTPCIDAKDEKRLFHDYPILLQMEIVSTADRREVLGAVRRGISESDGTVMRCFIPRHGLRIVENGRIIDYLICFECLWLIEYADGKVSEKPTTKSPQSVLDDCLKKAPR
jgi:hypothetical protein